MRNLDELYKKLDLNDNVLKSKGCYNGYYIIVEPPATRYSDEKFIVVNKYHPDYTYEEIEVNYLNSIDSTLEYIYNYICSGNSYLDFYLNEDLENRLELSDFEDKCSMLAHIYKLKTRYFDRANIQFRFKDNKLSKLYKDFSISNLSFNEIDIYNSIEDRIETFNLNEIRYIEIIYKRRIKNYIKVRYTIPELMYKSNENKEALEDIIKELNLENNWWERLNE